MGEILKDTNKQALETALKLDDKRLKVSLNGKELKLTRTEFRLLHRLITCPDQVFSRDHLIDSIYQDHRVVEHRTVDSHIKNLRHKLFKVMPGQDLIHSVYGIGYQYKETFSA